MTNLGVKYWTDAGARDWTKGRKPTPEQLKSIKWGPQALGDRNITIYQDLVINQMRLVDASKKYNLTSARLGLIRDLVDRKLRSKED